MKLYNYYLCVESEYLFYYSQLCEQTVMHTELSVHMYDICCIIVVAAGVQMHRMYWSMCDVHMRHVWCTHAYTITHASHVVATVRHVLYSPHGVLMYVLYKVCRKCGCTNEQYRMSQIAHVGFVLYSTRVAYTCTACTQEPDSCL